MKKRKKYVRYGIYVVLVLAACLVPVVLLYLRRRRGENAGEEATENEAAEPETARKETIENGAAERETTGRETIESEAAKGKTAERKTVRSEAAEKEIRKRSTIRSKAAERKTTEKETIESEAAKEKSAERENTGETKACAEDAPSEVSADKGHRKGNIKKALKCAAGGLYAALILGICIAPLLFLWSRPGGGAAENRTMASLPEFWTSEGFNWNCLSEAGDYFTDHFAFRQETVALNAGIRAQLFGVSPAENVIVGKNGWLYYAATLDDYQHKNSVSERMLFNMAHNVALMQEYSESLGKTFIFTVAPNKNTLYDENMPDRLQFRDAEESDAERLVPWLVREEVNYVDLVGLFEGQDEVLYYARDSHWNEKGAVMVYNALLDACGKPHETYGDSKPAQETDYFGDLGLMLFPVGGKPESRLRYPVGDTWRYAEGETVEDPFIRTVNEAGEGNLLMYRDSFGNSLLPYMAQAFSQAVFSKQVPYPMSDLVTCEPDILIVEKVERHLPTLGTVPPLMSAPLRTSGKGCVSVKHSGATVGLSKEGSYWKFEGAADPAYMDTDSRIYLEVDDGSGPRLYEAFCVSRPGGESGSADDYGYALYLSEVLVTGNTFHIRMMTEQEEAMVVLLEKQIQG